MLGREQPYGMPTSMMEILHINPSTFTDNIANVYSPILASGSAIGNPGRTIQPQVRMGFGSQAMPTLTTNYVMSMRQQLNESNHDMVNTLTQQMGNIFSPLIRNTNQSYQQLATQMSRIVDFFGASQMPIQPIVQPQLVPKI